MRVIVEKLMQWWPRATLSTTNPTWLNLGLNPGRRGGKYHLHFLILYPVLNVSLRGLNSTAWERSEEETFSRFRPPKIYFSLLPHSFSSLSSLYYPLLLFVIGTVTVLWVSIHEIDCLQKQGNIDLFVLKRSVFFSVKQILFFFS
jgi:hypothetical protein